MKLRSMHAMVGVALFFGVPVLGAGACSGGGSGSGSGEGPVCSEGPGTCASGCRCDTSCTSTCDTCDKYCLRSCAADSDCDGLTYSDGVTPLTCSHCDNGSFCGPC
jgi:hypothetical protein